MADKFLLATTGTQINMVSSWEDELYCSILKDGSISLRGSKDGLDEYGGRWWFQARRGIKTPKQFIEAFNSMMDEIDIDHWSVKDDLLPVLFNHAPIFAALTNKFIEIDDDGTDEELDFFLFSQKVILNSNIELPQDWKSAVKVIEAVYDFVKQEFNLNNKLPRGTHHLSDISVSFPNKALKSSKDLKQFRVEQVIKNHARNAEWEMLPRTWLQVLAVNSQYRNVLDFCRTYFQEHKELPVGKFKVGQVEVKFKSASN